jgi:tetratricopeptide (TPR) repeat protein
VPKKPRKHPKKRSPSPKNPPASRRKATPAGKEKTDITECPAEDSLPAATEDNESFPAVFRMLRLREHARRNPDFVEAHRCMGIILLDTGHPRRALEHLQRAAQLDSGHARTYALTSLAYYHLEMPAEAEMAARRTIQLDSTDERAHFILGLSLLQSGRYTEEGLASLRRVSPGNPKARLATAQMLAGLQRYEEASDVLRQYLRDGIREGRTVARSWLAELDAMDRSAETAGPSKSE